MQDRMTLLNLCNKKQQNNDTFICKQLSCCCTCLSMSVGCTPKTRVKLISQRVRVHFWGDNLTLWVGILLFPAQFGNPVWLPSSEYIHMTSNHTIPLSSLLWSKTSMQSYFHCQVQTQAPCSCSMCDTFLHTCNMAVGQTHQAVFECFRTQSTTSPKNHTTKAEKCDRQWWCAAPEKKEVCD